MTFQSVCFILLIEHDWDRDSPIPLSAYKPVSQSILSGLLKNILAKLGHNVPLSLLKPKTCRCPTINQSFVNIIEYFLAFDFVFGCECSVIIAMSWYTHHSTGAVICTNVGSYIDWNFISCQRMFDKNIWNLDSFINIVKVDF
jgi:hypothetical protein